MKNSASDIGMPSSTFFSELTEGLTRFCSISEISPLVTPARFASSRCDRPYMVPDGAQVGADVDRRFRSRGVQYPAQEGRKYRKFQADLSRRVNFSYHRGPPTPNSTVPRRCLPSRPSTAPTSKPSGCRSPRTGSSRRKPRLLARAEGMHYWTPDGRQILDGAPACGASTPATAARRSPRRSAGRSPTMDFAPPFQMGHPRAFELANAAASDWLPAGPRPRVLHELRLGVGRHRAEDRARLPPRPRRGHAHAPDRPRARLSRRRLRRHLGRRHGQQPQGLRRDAARRRSPAAHARPRAQRVHARPAASRARSSPTNWSASWRCTTRATSPPSSSSRWRARPAC